MGNTTLVLALFDNEGAADAAVNSLKQWDKASKDIKLGSIGVLVKDDKGKVKTHKLGARRSKTGVILGVVAAVLSGGVTLLGGVVGGGIIGAFFHKGLGLSKDDVARIDGYLSDGKAMVAVVADPTESAAIYAKLTELGGKTETHEVTDAAVEQAEVAADATDAEPAAADAAPAEEPKAE
jgi:uncharacterized membrane protein